jgi:hypothetical protein
MAEIVEPAGGFPVTAVRNVEYFSQRTRVGSGVSSATITRRFVLALSIAYLAKQLITVIVFPAFTGHDEVAHYAYLRTVAEEGRLPILLEDRLPVELYPYCRYVLQWWCEPWNPRWLNDPPVRMTNGELEGMQYAANHPPLYYVLMTPVYWLSAGGSPEFQQYLLRIAVIPFGLIVVLLAYRTTTALFPRDAFLAFTVPTFVAFQPQVSYEAAMVNNDIVAIALYSAILFVLVSHFRDGYSGRTSIVLGVLLGLALLTKGTSLTAAPVIGLSLVVSVGLRNAGDIMRRGLVIAGSAVAVAWPWYFFLWRTYGNLSGLPQIAELQQWNRPLGGFFELLLSREFVIMRFHETWGYFGWRLIPLPAWLLWAIAIPLLFAVGGLVQYAVTARPGRSSFEDDAVMQPESWQRWCLLILAATFGIAYLAVVQFGTQFELTQARYFFPAINAAAILIMLGARTLIPPKWHSVSRSIVLLSMITLNAVIYSQFVIPFWHL